MAAKPIGINEVRGVVRHKGTGKPLPDLLVVAYDLDPHSENPDRDQIRVNTDPASPLNDPATFKSDLQRGLPNGVPGDRLGSVLTDKDGSFEIHYSDDAFRIRQKHQRIGGDDAGPMERVPDHRPDLFLVVLSAEQAKQDEFDNVLFRSNWARINAGRTETYLIEISSAALREMGIGIPKEEPDDGDVDSEVEKHKKHVRAQRRYGEKLTEFNNELELEDKPEKNNVAAAVSLATVRDISDFAADTSLVRFVQQGESVEKAQESVYKSGAEAIDAVIKEQNGLPGEGIKISVYLTDEEKTELEAGRFTHTDNEDYFAVAEDKVQSILLKREDDGGINQILFSDNPISKYCLERTTNEVCAKTMTSDAPQQGANEDPPDLTDESQSGKEDIPKLIKKVLFAKDINLFDENDDLSSRPDADSVQSSVNSFSLQKGPADATAFYDFDMLQVAFSHVWEQLVDKTLVNLGEKAHFSLKQSGRSSIFPTVQANTMFTKADFVYAVEASLGETDPIPASIVKNFDVHLLEYEALTPTQKDELERLSDRINELQDMVERQSATRYRPGYDYFVDNSDAIERLYDQGEMILENIRINKPNSTQSILKELHERLTEPYEFTVFAANKTHHSVNFGLMNTYRQKWEPVSYQAGQLAKTIPMAPKEERKYSVSVKQKRNVSEKQAEQYNSAVKSESSLTSRAESDIVAKAQKKSEFDFNVKASYTKVSSKLGVGKDASKDSSEAKKSFRESVIKAAQEFKDEWSLTVESEESFESEQTESGTIVNPNDELSVTYLFYQLQRRYRVSEQLHRTMPVVLVALEVPAPHEITEGWIIANDWILNRALLDDSFRPALELVATKSIGSAYAIRELRKSMREQRRLVRTLEREFAKLEQEVDNKYNRYRETVDERIDEEHDKRFYKRRIWHWLFGGGEKPEDKPDPEMAKALEQAAADDHAYAVEQSKNLSMSLQREARNLQSIVREYNKVMEEHLNRKLAAKRLITHVKENILYYMQAIWSMEPPDQRFMRLHKVKVPSFEVTRSCVVADTPSKDLFEAFRTDGKKKYDAWLHGTIKKTNGQPDVEYKSLVEVAELDTVLGFKGNYIMFPLKEHNGLTKLMAAPYVDEAFGAMDPDQLSNITLEEFSEYVCCLHHEDKDEFDRLKPVLLEWLNQLLANPLRNGDEVIVPTDSLFIEMLPSDKSLLEDFKLKHRQMDVMKVRAEVREQELENIRYAARLLGEDYSDPDIEKRIHIDGDAGVLVGDN